MELDQLAAALVKAQAEFPAVPKSGKNPHLNNDYSTLDDVINAVRGPLGKHGLSFVQLLSSTTDGSIFLQTILLHESGQKLEGEVIVAAGEANRGVNALQALGAGITYMKRYALSAMLGVATDSDTDGNGAHAPAPQRQAQRPQSQPMPASERPLDGPTIRKVIRQKAGWQGGEWRPTDGEPITQGQVKAVGSLMSEAVTREGMNQAMIDKARHDILGYLVNVNETMRLTKSEASAIISWLKEEESWGLNGYARQEAENVLTALAKDAGQQEVEF